MAKKFTAKNLPRKVIFDLASLERERDRLYVSKDDPERLAKVINRINHFNFGETIIPETDQ